MTSNSSEGRNFDTAAYQHVRKFMNQNCILKTDNKVSWFQAVRVFFQLESGLAKIEGGERGWDVTSWLSSSLTLYSSSAFMTRWWLSRSSMMKLFFSFIIKRICFTAGSLQCLDRIEKCYHCKKKVLTKWKGRLDVWAVSDDEGVYMNTFDGSHPDDGRDVIRLDGHSHTNWHQTFSWVDDDDGLMH